MHMNNKQNKMYKNPFWGVGTGLGSKVSKTGASVNPPVSASKVLGLQAHTSIYNFYLNC